MKFLEKHITVTLCSRGEKVVNLKCHKHLYGWQRGNQIDFFLQDAIIWGQEEHVDGFVQISAVSGE